MSWSYGPPNSNYWAGRRPREAHGLKTSPTEIGHLSLAFVVLTLDFVVLQLVDHMYDPAAWITGAGNPPLAVYTEFAVAAGLTGFIAHEMAHKVVAQLRGLWAEFRASPIGLLISFVTVNFGFLFAAPGATVVDGYGDLEDWGLISIAGPLTNLSFGAVFLAAYAVLGGANATSTLAGSIGLLAFINGWWATFNLIPIGPLDGRKVYRWSKGAWVATIVIGALLAIATFLVP